MPKMRVHELAKEINKTSAELIELLNKMKITDKTHASMLSEEEVARVKHILARKRRPPEKKRKNIIQVFNPHNSRMSGGPDERLKKKAAEQKAEEEYKRRKQEEQRQEAERQAALAREATLAKIAQRLKADAPEEQPKGKDAAPKTQPAASAETPVKNAQKPEPETAPEKTRETVVASAETGKTAAGQTDSKASERPRMQKPVRSDGARGGRGDGQRPVRNDGQRGTRPEGARRDRDASFTRKDANNRPARESRDGQQKDRPRGAFHDNARRDPRNEQQKQGRFSGGRDQDRKKDRLSSDFAMQQQKNERSNQRKDKDKDRVKKDHDRFEHQSSKVRSNKNQIKAPVAKPVKKEPEEEVIKSIILPEKLTIRELAEKMKIQPAVIVKKLFLQGTMVTVNAEIDYDTAEEIALEFNCIAEPEVKVDVIAELLKEEEEDPATLEKRAPVVCVMGHVDHGKTSLLDAIRNTRVTDKEAGGITQAIGAYVVECNGRDITFLDTPGHEAFTAMRMRGANATDIAILVVSADDGIMPQTIEAINHAKAAEVEIIVAINKIDKPDANVSRVMQQLTEYDLVPEEYGGSTIVVPVSAKTREGIDNLLEMVLLSADILELKANPNRRARGIVIEAKLDKGKGPVATILVQKGTLHVGDFIAAGSCYGRVRAMLNDKGQQVKQVGPSTPVEILGFNDVPQAGDVFVNPATDKEAKHFAETFIAQNKEKLLEDTKSSMSLEDLFSEIKAGNVKELNLIVKADVQGSVEAVKSSLIKLSNDEVVVKVIHSAAGAINESDVILASASNAIIIGFNSKPDAMAKATAEREGVDVRLYRVIYDAIADVEAAMKGMLDPVYEEQIIGHGECRQTFKASGVGTIAGSYVLDGIFTRDCKIRVTREGEQIFDGPLTSLKRFKDDVREVKSGFECGLVFENFNDVKEGDQFEAYKMVEVPR